MKKTANCAPNKECMTIEQAARELGLSELTIKSWLRLGRLPCLIKEETIVRKVNVVLIPRFALETAFDVICLWCGKRFRAKHPQKARYCCSYHRVLASHSRNALKAGKPHRQYRLLQKRHQAAALL